MHKGLALWWKPKDEDQTDTAETVDHSSKVSYSPSITNGAYIRFMSNSHYKGDQDICQERISKCFGHFILSREGFLMR